MASLSTCHLGLWLGWQILLNLVKSNYNYEKTKKLNEMLPNISAKLFQCFMNQHHLLALPEHVAIESYSTLHCPNRSGVLIQSYHYIAQ